MKPSVQFDLSEYSIIKIRGKLLEIPLNQDNRYHDRDYPLNVKTNNFIRRNLEALTGVNFGIEFFFAPATLVAAEHNKQKRTQRKERIGNQEVFKVQHAAAFAKGLETRKQVESESTRK